jgi:hypothetical protein
MGLQRRPECYAATSLRRRFGGIKIGRGQCVVNPIKLLKRIGRYVVAAVVGAVLLGGPFGVGGPGWECGIYGYCRPGHTPYMFLIVLALGAIIGVVGMALFDVAVSARYALANRAMTPPMDGF